MKISRFRQYITATLLISMACLLQGCPVMLPPSDGPVFSTAKLIGGIWVWDSTTTPIRVYTPKTAGFTRQLVIMRDGISGNYISFYRNDTLQRQLNEAVGDTNPVIEDNSKLTVLIAYTMPGSGYVSGPKEYLKCSLNHPGARESLIVGEFMNPYSDKADTVRHYYTRVYSLPGLYPH